MNRWQIGDVRITRVVEMEYPTPCNFLFPNAKPEMIVREAEWLNPWAITADGQTVVSFYSLVVESQGRKIMVDTCVGNDKDRTNTNPAWTNRKGPFLADLERAGFTPDQFDYVLQTHLHVDHVGWNTILRNGRWVPTFDNARYLIGGIEWDFYSTYEDRALRDPVEDSVRPIVEQGRANLIESTHRITDEVWLEPSPGHTPGHHHVHIASRGQEAIITGDLMHHPIQTAWPQWDVGFDNDGAKAKKVRRAFCEEFADRDVLIFGTHFATPSCGKIVRRGDAFRFVPQR